MCKLKNITLCMCYWFYIAKVFFLFCCVFYVWPVPIILEMSGEKKKKEKCFFVCLYWVKLCCWCQQAFRHWQPFRHTVVIYCHTLIYTFFCPPCSMFVFGGMSSRIHYERLRAEGAGTNERALPFLNQDYEALKQECLESGSLFEDPCFPARPPSLGFKELAPHSSKTRGVEWKRPNVSHVIYTLARKLTKVTRITVTDENAGKVGVFEPVDQLKDTPLSLFPNSLAKEAD